MKCTQAAATLPEHFATLMASPSCKKHERKEKKTVELLYSFESFNVGQVHRLEARLLHKTDRAGATDNAMIIRVTTVSASLMPNTQYDDIPLSYCIPMPHASKLSTTPDSCYTFLHLLPSSLHHHRQGNLSNQQRV